MSKESRNCLKDPIPELYDAARYLDAAVSAHMSGNKKIASALIEIANMPSVREWTESLWGSGGIYTKLQKKLGATSKLKSEDRDPLRMPNKQGEREILARDGHYCRFCGIPVIRKEVRDKLRKLYPEALQWGSTNQEQHAAFQALWVQYDHVIPHARGGKTTLNNMVITCAPCNYGRMNYLLEEVDLILPQIRISEVHTWNGLERILK